METVKKYSWKYGNGCGVAADVVGAEFEAIENELGVITKQAVVERAKSEDSPLHRMFEWNNDIAGDLYRCEQARHYIAALAVEVVPVGTPNGKPIKTRGYVNVAELNDAANQPNGQYISVDNAMSNPVHRGIVLARAKRQFVELRNKYETLEELQTVFDAIDAVC